MCVYVCVCVRACVRACGRACVRACVVWIVCVHVCVRVNKTKRKTPSQGLVNNNTSSLILYFTEFLTRWNRTIRTISIHCPLKSQHFVNISPSPYTTRSLSHHPLATYWNPCMMHTTLASFLSHESSQMVPQTPSWNTSTRPSRSLYPSIRRSFVA